MNNNWTKGCDFGFKVGQKAWHIQLGWGTVTKIDDAEESYHMTWVSDSGWLYTFMLDGCQWGDHIYPSLFHVEQTFDFGRPAWQPQPGELCWVWNYGELAPCVRNFVKVIKGRNHFKSVTSGSITMHWNHFAPFNNGELPDEFKHLLGGEK